MHLIDCERALVFVFSLYLQILSCLRVLILQYHSLMQQILWNSEHSNSEHMSTTEQFPVGAPGTRKIAFIPNEQVGSRTLCCWFSNCCHQICSYLLSMPYTRAYSRPMLHCAFYPNCRECIEGTHLKCAEHVGCYLPCYRQLRR